MYVYKSTYAHACTYAGTYTYTGGIHMHMQKHAIACTYTHTLIVDGSLACLLLPICFRTTTIERCTSLTKKACDPRPAGELLVALTTYSVAAHACVRPT